MIGVVLPALPEVLAESSELELLLNLEQSTEASSAAFVVLVPSPGLDTPTVQRSEIAVVVSHSQHGSPSSSPFVCPSPSESVLQSFDPRATTIDEEASEIAKRTLVNRTIVSLNRFAEQTTRTKEGGDK
ncbi:uncharacterized protein KRP23_1773 [Phytophthora ramorum]|uniref:uncharacterized protein n=1 Tax=Phytophthora ramorum TaxID=164328 RepID=UPI0030B280C5|nr:hypothetical protein KRP23_1773 [Phytophthora ramorum]